MRAARRMIAGVGAAMAALAFATAALADPASLKASPVDADGQVTLGDVFDNAGAASEVVIGRRTGPSVVFEAGQLQLMARQAGLDWANPTGLRRVVVRDAGMAPSGGSIAPVGAAPAAARAAPVRAAYGQQVIRRNDIIDVTYEVGGVRLTVSGRAEGNAAEGQRLVVRNLQSNRIIDAVAVGPGQAMAGAAARSQQFASR